MICNKDAFMPAEAEVVVYQVDESWFCYSGVLLAHETAFWLWLTSPYKYGPKLMLPEDRYFPCSERNVDFFGIIKLNEK